MISVSDFIKLLDEIPIWKAISGLPKRVAELERKIQVLEKGAAAAAPSPLACPICGSTMKVTSEAPDHTFGFANLMTHFVKCPDCGTQTTRQYKPGKGYE